MKKILTFILFMALVTPAWSAIQWRNGTGEQVLDGTTNANLIGYNSYNKAVQPLDNLLSGYCTEWLQYLGQSTITIKAGSCVVSNSGGTIRMFMLDTTDTNISAASNMDTGSSLSTNTTYYVYATSLNSTTQTSTYYISLSSTAPSGQSYYFKIGQFTTDGSGYILPGTISTNNHVTGTEYVNSTVYFSNNSNLNGKTISNGFLGKTTTGSLATFSSGSTVTVPTGCYVIGGFKQSDGNFTTWNYACP